MNNFALTIEMFSFNFAKDFKQMILKNTNNAIFFIGFLFSPYILTITNYPYIVTKYVS